MISDPLHRLDCCVISDGGGAIVVVKPEIAARLKRPRVRLLGAGEAVKHQMGGQHRPDVLGRRLVGAGGVRRGRRQAGGHQVRVDLRQLHHHRAHHAGGPRLLRQGAGRQVRRPTATSSRATGKLPFNTDGGGLCNNHPANRGGLTKVVEAVRQLRGEAHPKVQVKNCDVALAHGTGGSLGTRHGSATLIMGRE